MFGCLSTKANIAIHSLVWCGFLFPSGEPWRRESSIGAKRRGSRLFAKTACRERRAVKPTSLTAPILRSMRLGVGADRAHRPGHALGDHVGGHRCIFLEMLGGPVRFEGRFVVIDFIQKQVVWIVGENEDVELPAAGLLNR